MQSRTGESAIRDFPSTRTGLLEFKDWILEERCELVAMESTGVYWYALYATLEDHIEVILANPYLIKIFREGRPIQPMHSGSRSLR